MSEVITSTEPSPILVIAALTEAVKSVLGEVRSLAAETFKFQLQMMELIPAEQRLEAFKAVVEANSAAILSDERVTLAMLATVEKFGAAAAQILPPVLALRQQEISARMAEMVNNRREAADRAAVEGIRTKASTVNGKVTVAAE